MSRLTDSTAFLSTLAVCNIYLWLLVVVAVAQQLPNEDLRTFIYVWSSTAAISGASVYVERKQSDSIAPIRFSFPKTNEGGWTHRQIPDGDYTLFIEAEGFKPHRSQITVPSGKRYKFRDFPVMLEPKE